MYWSPQLFGSSFQKARNFTASIAGFSIWVFKKKFPGVIPPDPHSERGRLSPVHTPSSASGRARVASASVLGPKPWSPSTFQLWLRPWKWPGQAGGSRDGSVEQWGIWHIFSMDNTIFLITSRAHGDGLQTKAGAEFPLPSTLQPLIKTFHIFWLGQSP